MIYSSDVGTTKGRPVRFGPFVGIYEWHVVKISLICTFNHNQQNCFDFSHFHLKIIIKMKKIRFRYLKDPQSSIYSHRCQTWCLIGGIIRYNFKSISKDNLCQVLFQIMDCIRIFFQLMAMHIRYGLLSDPVLMKIIIVQQMSSLGKTRLKRAERNFVSNLETTTLKSKLGHFSSCACS